LLAQRLAAAAHAWVLAVEGFQGNREEGARQRQLAAHACRDGFGRDAAIAKTARAIKG
jgi:hypothetical protein